MEALDARVSMLEARLAKLENAWCSGKKWDLTPWLVFAGLASAGLVVYSHGMIRGGLRLTWAGA